MPLSWLDIILVSIMVLSALLAMMRGVTREVLSISSWGGAAAAAFFAYLQPELREIAHSYVQPQNNYLADIVLVIGVFFIVLIVLSFLTIRLSDRILDSRIGALDRTLGFVFGLARGLAIVVVAYMFYSWIIPKEKQFMWIKTARTLPIIELTSDLIISQLPPDAAEALRGGHAQPIEPVPENGGDKNNDTGNDATSKPIDESSNTRGTGYGTGERRTLKQLVKGSADG